MSDQPVFRLSDFLSSEELALLTSGGKQLIENMGMDVIRDVVLDVLSGRNIRASTETLTRRRIATLNLALFHMFAQAISTYPQFIEQLPFIATANLVHAKKASRVDTLLSLWLLGLTGKGIQNVLRGDRTLLPEYRDAFIRTCQEVVEEYKAIYGEINGEFTLNQQKIILNWEFLNYLLTATGAQTLTIRGSEKSLYGKFFEKLVLGALLAILDFEYLSDKQSPKTERVFWLSSQSQEDRESDATLLFRAGQGVRFDIGFIGSGNTEISLDKVSRYRREVELGATTWFMGTIIIVDRIGAKSKIVGLAEKIDGTIIQMSAGFWIQRVARQLEDLFGYTHPITHLDHEAVEDYLRAKLNQVPLHLFLHKTFDNDDMEGQAVDE